MAHHLDSSQSNHAPNIGNVTGSSATWPNATSLSHRPGSWPVFRAVDFSRPDCYRSAFQAGRS